jgi:sigma-B regulation protein RsbU (phosphoserine phosphatase)
MGKGAPAALLASALRASLHSLARNELALRSVLNKANRFFHESSKDGMFATLFYAELDVKARRLIYINAGHPPALIVRASGDRASLSSSGLPLGIVERSHYLEEFAALEPGDVLAVYTDGLMEHGFPTIARWSSSRRRRKWR